VPLTSMPSVIQRVVIALPSGAMAEALHRVLGTGGVPTIADWVSLGAWAVVAPLLAARTFRFD